jgi:8-oxo-dGTP pyrophosphatase MutT (NUDIX family)
LRGEEPEVGDPARWTTLGSDYVYRSPWLMARRDRVRLGNGRVLDDYYVLEYPDWVNAVLLTPDQQLVLIRIYRHGLGEVHYELPGGCIDPGESPEDAARREAVEETGYHAESWESLGVTCANPATHSNRTYLFLARGATWASAAEPEATEEIVTRLVSRAEAAEILRRGEMISASHALALTRALASLEAR